MTTDQLVTRLRYVVGNARGDDLERATAAFRNLTDAQLDEQYGQSGQTCRQIWDGYKQHRAEHNELAEFLEGVIAGAGL